MSEGREMTYRSAGRIEGKKKDKPASAGKDGE